MKLLLLVIFILMFFQKNNYGQDFDKCWPLGVVPITPGLHSNLVFTPSGIRIDTAYREIEFGLTEASISDGSGNLLIYTNGCTVMNAMNDTMLNGDSINRSSCQNSLCSVVGGNVTQGSLILPDPLNSNMFYIFHEPCGPGSTGSPINLYYSKVDLSLDSGRGALVNGNTSLFSGNLSHGSLTAVKHANGNDWWVLLHEKSTTRFIRYLLTNLGISGPYFQTIGINYYSDGHGDSKFSPDGSMYASSTQLGGIDLFHFDRCSGLMSNYEYIDLPDSLFINFIEFSPDSRLLYASSYLVLNQFDLYAANIQASGQQVAIFDGFNINTAYTYFWMLQNGPDQKIYMSCAPGNIFLHVIDQPNVIGTGCNVFQHSIALPNSNEVLPNLVNYRLGALDSVICDTTNSIDDNTIASDRIIIFPNPASEFISISTVRKNELIESFRIFDQLGRVVKSEIYSDETTNIRELKSGLYFIEVVSNKGKYFKKFVVSD